VICSSFKVPQAKDGSVFSPALERKGGFTVGTKGDERRIVDFDEALAFLKSQPTARWRRPNDKGIWGIVTGIQWVDFPDI
jgi:hypothetical protein